VSEKSLHSVNSCDIIILVSFSFTLVPNNILGYISHYISSENCLFSNWKNNPRTMILGLLFPADVFVKKIGLEKMRIHLLLRFRISMTTNKKATRYLHLNISTLLNYILVCFFKFLKYCNTRNCIVLRINTNLMIGSSTDLIWNLNTLNGIIHIIFYQYADNIAHASFINLLFHYKTRFPSLCCIVSWSMSAG